MPRLAYLQSHVRDLTRTIGEGVPERAYHCWSLMDNFRWAEGFAQPFGLVHVNFADRQQRTIENSGYSFAKVAAANRVP